jgi:hypothetical protein
MFENRTIAPFDGSAAGAAEPVGIRSGTKQRVTLYAAHIDLSRAKGCALTLLLRPNIGRSDLEGYMKRRLAYQMGCVIAALWALPHGANAAAIATVTDVINEGYRTPPGADETAAKTSDELVQEEALRTEKESAIQVRFIDGSELSVEQSSEMVLSDYVFDGSATTGTIDLNSGLFHFKSSGLDDQGVQLRTPGRDHWHSRYRVPGPCRQ